MLPDTTCDFCGQPSCPPCPEADKRMQRAIDRYTGLLEVLTGPSWQEASMHLVTLGELWELTEAEGRVVDAIIARIRAAFNAYRYTVEDAARLLDVSPREVRRLARRGLLGGATIKGRWMFTDYQIERYLSPGGTPTRGADVGAVAELAA